MAQDNTLGAPTEGLGQTVTFASNGGGGVPQTQAMQRQLLRNNPTGGAAVLTARALQIPDSGAGETFRTLAKLAGDALRPHIEAERTAAYVSGMQQAAQGQAIQEIVDEQPWYSKLFGSTSLVDGARAYTASAKATQAAVEMEQNMPELRKLPPDQFSRRTAEMLTRYNTGDAATDMILQQQLAATLPSVMKQQSKEYLKYKAEALYESQAADTDAKMARLGQLAARAKDPNSTISLTDASDLEVALSNMLVPLPDMSREVHDKMLGESTMKALQAGNFAAFQFMRDSGKLAAMDPAVSARVDRAYSLAVSEAKTKLPVEFAEKIANFMVADNDPKNTPEVLKATAETLNKEFSGITGIDEPYISVQALGQGLANLRLTQQREAEQEKLRLARQREAAINTGKSAEADEAAIKGLSGLIARLEYVGDIPPKTLSASWDYLELTRSPEDMAKIRAHHANRKSIDARYQDITQGAILDAAATRDVVALKNLYELRYLPLVKAGGPTAAAKYMGEGAAIMERYHVLAGGRAVDVNDAARIGAQASAELDRDPTRKANKDTLKVLKDYSWVDKATSEKFPVRNPDGLERVLRVREGLDPKTATAIAMDEAEAEGRVTILAGYHWTRAPGQADVKAELQKAIVGGVAAVPDGEVNQAFNYAVTTRMGELGLEGAPTITQVDVGGKPKLVITAKVRGRDQATTVTVTPDEMRRLWQDKKARTAGIAPAELRNTVPANRQAAEEQRRKTPQPVTLFGVPIN